MIRARRKKESRLKPRFNRSRSRVQWEALRRLQEVRHPPLLWLHPGPRPKARFKACGRRHRFRSQPPKWPAPGPWGRRLRGQPCSLSPPPRQQPPAQASGGAEDNFNLWTRPPRKESDLERSPMRMKIMRYIWVGFFLLLFTGFTSCASTKAQNQGKSDTPSSPRPVLGGQAATPQRIAGSTAAIPEKKGGDTATTPAKAEISPPQPAPPKPPEGAMRSPL